MTKLLLHVPPALIAEVDAFAQRKGIAARAEAVRALLRMGIDSDKPTLRGMLTSEEKAVLQIAERLRQRCGDADKLKTMERLYVSTVAEVEGTDDASLPRDSEASSQSVKQPPTSDKPKAGGVLSKFMPKRKP